ncbi:reverse transcriptase domain-containing protein [Tanacetum coccineum]
MCLMEKGYGEENIYSILNNFADTIKNMENNNSMKMSVDEGENPNIVSCSKHKNSPRGSFSDVVNADKPATKLNSKKVIKDEDGFFFFKFALLSGVEQVLEQGGHWLYATSLELTYQMVTKLSLTKVTVSKVPVAAVKMHKVPVVAYSEDGLSLIATQVSMEKELKQEVIMGVPEVEGTVHTNVKIQVEYEWKPPLCHDCHVFGHNDDQCPKRVIETVTVKLDAKMIVSAPAGTMETESDDIDVFKLKNQFDSLRNHDDFLMEKEVGESSGANI